MNVWHGLYCSLSQKVHLYTVLFFFLFMPTTKVNNFCDFYLDALYDIVIPKVFFLKKGNVPDE